LLIAATTFGFTQNLTAPPLNLAGKWTVDELPSGCRASQTFGAKGDKTFWIVDRPITDNHLLGVVLPNPIKVSYNDPVRVTLDPSGLELRGRAVGFDPYGGRPTTLAVYVDAGALSNDAVSAIRVVTKKETIAYLSISHLPELVVALKACKRALLSKFSVNLTEQAFVATPPKSLSDEASWFSADDYPPDLWREGVQGTVAGRFRVMKDGSATDCVVVFSSGNAALDRRTCALVLNRARYSPALSKEGRPVPSAQIFSAHWSL